MDPVNAPSFLAHEKVIRAPCEFSTANRNDTSIISGSRREVLAFATSAEDINAKPVEAGEGEVKIKQPEVLVRGGIGVARSVARATGREKPGFFSGAANCLVKPQKSGVLNGFNDSAL